jgi:hypothetical protein
VRTQDAFLRDFELPIAACKSFRTASNASASATDYYDDGFHSMHNLFCQLNSLAAVTSMWRETRRNYDAVLYLRPDVLFNCRLPVEQLDVLAGDTVYVPDFHHWHGWNDRFAMAAPAAAALWGDRRAPAARLVMELVLATSLRGSC